MKRLLLVFFLVAVGCDKTQKNVHDFDGPAIQKRIAEIEKEEMPDEIVIRLRKAKYGTFFSVRGEKKQPDGTVKIFPSILPKTIP